MPNQQNNTTDKALFIGLTVFLLTVVVYHAILRPLWVESFGAVEIPVCNQMVLTLPGEIPRSFQGDNVLPDRAAVIRGDWAFHVTLTQGGQALSMEGGKEYYVWVPPDYPWDKVFIDISGEAECHRSLSVHVESKTDYLAKRIAALLFGLPFATLVALFGAGWKVYQHREEKRQEQRERLRQLEEGMEQVSAPEQALRYYHLWQENFLEDKVSLRRWWNNYAVRFSETEQRAITKIVIAKHWLPCLKTNVDKSTPCSPKCQEMLDNIKESGLLLLKDEYDALSKKVCALSSIQHNFIPLIRLLGLHPDLVDLLAKYYKLHSTSFPETFKQWKNSLQHIGFAVGKAVYDKISSENDKTTEILENPPAPRSLPLRLALWPPIPPSNTCAYWDLTQFQGPTDMPSPFGPVKAENDPRLPLKFHPSNSAPALGLFWEGSPFWQALQDPEPTWLHIKPGCGTTTLIWTARHRYRYWGTNGPALSLYIPVNDIAPSEEFCRRAAQKALAKSILANLAEDPTWFLGIPHPAWQRDILSLLYHHYGTAEHILGQITLPQPPENDTTFLTLAESIRSFSPTENTYPWQAKPWKTLNEILLTVRSSMAQFGSRAGRQPNTPVIILVKLLSSSKTDSLEWLVSHCSFWQWGTVKVFASASPPPVLNIPVQHCAWRENDLVAMLAHRLHQIAAKQNEIGETALSTALHSILDMSNDTAADWETLTTQIFYQAGKPTTPKALIQWGNQRAQERGLCRAK